MEFKRIKTMNYYCCPACNTISTTKAEIEKHLREDHQIKTERFIYCNICGCHWNVQTIGEEAAIKRAEQCFQSHIDSGNADQIASQCYFASHGRFGYLKYVKGGIEDK